MKRVLKNRLRHEVIVTLKTQDAFRGILNEHDDQAIVLCSASGIDPQSDTKYISANGEIVILIAEIAYFQFI